MPRIKMFCFIQRFVIKDLETTTVAILDRLLHGANTSPHQTRRWRLDSNCYAAPVTDESVFDFVFRDRDFALSHQDMLGQEDSISQNLASFQAPNREPSNQSEIGTTDAARGKARRAPMIG